MTAIQDDLADRMARAVNGLLNRYLVRGADGAERAIPYNPVDYQTLRFVAGGEARATDVAEHLGVPPTTMQSALDRLTRRGLLAKRASPKDRRARLYALTEEGARIHAAIERQDRANMAAMMEALSPAERATLTTLMERIAKG